MTKPNPPMTGNTFIPSQPNCVWRIGLYGLSKKLQRNQVVTIAAPGGTVEFPIYSLGNSGLRKSDAEIIAEKKGTSMAAPHVSGVIALMYAVKPDITPYEVKEILVRSARPFPCGGNCQSHETVEGWWPWLSDIAYRYWHGQHDCGAGILDGGAAVREADRRYNHPEKPTQLTVKPGCACAESSWPYYAGSALGAAVVAGTVGYCIRHRGR